MLDSGNFVLYDYNNISRIIWQSFDHPTDTLLEGQSLPPGSHLTSSLSETNSSTGRFHLYMQAIAFPIKTTSNRAVVHIIVSSVIFCSAIFISIHYMYKIRVLKYKRLIETGNIGGLSEDLALRRFTYNELEKLVEEGEREFHAEVRAIGKTHHRC